MLDRAAALLLALAPLPAFAQQAPLSIHDAAWLAGRWVGEGLGGKVEENWSPVQGGQMVGHFTLYNDDAPVFYEIMLMDVQPGGIRLRVKHFNPDFTAWEDKAGWHAFEPISTEKESLRFNGLWLRREGEELLITIRLKDKAGEAKDHLLRLRRAS
ncbi:MAG: hypothetical protein EOP62_15250 [Sphingomonadales bacterium]|nr:MAG: hypothetical protein EOP62_15250 [Sphingomonadales bacterium]